MTMPDQTPSMPPLPEPDATTVGQGQMWNRHSVHAYAQAVADERVREALELAAKLADSTHPAYRDRIGTAIRALAISTLSLGGPTP